jgi:hypothetical protein
MVAKRKGNHSAHHHHPHGTVTTKQKSKNCALKCGDILSAPLGQRLERLADGIHYKTQQRKLST